MHTLIRSATWSIALLTVIASGTAAQGVNAAVREWLLNACGVGESTVTTGLLTVGSNAVPQLVAAFERGPARADRETVRAAAARRFALITFILDRGRSAGLSVAHLEAARRLTLDQYTERAVTDFAFLYQSEALRALGILGGATAVTVLQRVAENPASPFARTAQLAINDLRRR